jgi:hypothetical protein
MVSGNIPEIRMLSLEMNNPEFREILRRELNLGPKSSYQSRELLKGTQLYDHTLFIITDADRSFLLIRGTFVMTDVYVLIRTAFPEDLELYRIAGELKEKGLDPRKTRLVCIAKNVSEGVPGGTVFPEIQIVMIPF